jgi:transposase InsO family protein
MRNKKWVRLLAYVTGSVNQEPLLQNEYPAAENLILRAKLPVRLRLSDPERATLAQVGKRLGRKALREVACIGRCWPRAGVKTILLPARSPNLNAFAERRVRSVKQECPSKLILFGERPLSRTLAEFSAHYHGERNHQGKGNKLLFPHLGDEANPRRHTVACRQRLGGPLKYYGRAA